MGAGCVQLSSLFACFPCRGFAVDKLLIVNRHKPDHESRDRRNVVCYILLGNDGNIKAVGNGNPPSGPASRTSYDAK